MQSVSALLVLIWVPVLTLGAYPLAERLGWRATPLRRMGVGMAFAALSFVICAWFQQRLEAGATLSLAWQVLPYTVLELGEVLLSASGLEFAYAQAPASLKSVVMSLWLLTTAVGNFLVAAITTINARFVPCRRRARVPFLCGANAGGGGVLRRDCQPLSHRRTAGDRQHLTPPIQAAGQRPEQGHFRLR